MTEVLGKGGITAKLIEDSISPAGVRLATLQLAYPRFIHSELMTHRVFSRNASSSRAIPVAKMIEQVRENPAMPIHWGKNQPGMQAKEEHDAPVVYHYPFSEVGEREFSIEQAWRIAAAHATDVASAMAAAGYHKQVVNRILEPFQFIHVVVTATEWDNFFELRAHADAQPEIHELAVCIRDAMSANVPAKLRSTEWHLPYVLPEERKTYPIDILVKLSAARCARVSYLKHDGANPDVDSDIALYDRLVGSAPIHASPVEHQATPLLSANLWSGNFRGWYQHRKAVEAGKSVGGVITI